MTPAEVRAIVERVVAEHGQGWSVVQTASSGERWTRAFCWPPGGGAEGFVVVTAGRVCPKFSKAKNEAECARAVALWPEMQRLVAMLREALR